MSESVEKVGRGRPKLLNREYVLDVVIQNYRQKGIEGFSINELCKTAKVSKPALYREFGNEDGLMSEALVVYEQRVLAKIFGISQRETSFSQELDNLVLDVISQTDTQQDPKGCLFSNMLDSRRVLGELTLAQINRTHQNIISALEAWIVKSKANGELTTEMSSAFVAKYIHTQIRYAKCQLFRGESSQQVTAILKLALSVFKE
ncbi:TetR/AcrR family transcriptional regulator [Vibrio gallicus]|uniref:TetR/AcrR family transcriptional regulator n=1 Tax=Vibrio gallicus TaxID=190897 RepID=UPI0021C3F4F6|nr:TetR/AcrR family transcriptional regulator [Vibrio gallicus]